jgi:hypothetical protein
MDHVRREQGLAKPMSSFTEGGRPGSKNENGVRSAFEVIKEHRDSIEEEPALDGEPEAVRNINKSAVRKSKKRNILDNRRFESPSIRNSNYN